MEISVLTNLSWKRQPEICEKVSKKQAKVLIWNRPKVERFLHWSVWAWSGEDLSVICIKQGFSVNLSVTLLKCAEQREEDWAQSLMTSLQTSRMNMGILLHCFQKKKKTKTKQQKTNHPHWHRASTDCTWGQPRRAVVDFEGNCDLKLSGTQEELGHGGTM